MSRDDNMRRERRAIARVGGANFCADDAALYGLCRVCGSPRTVRESTDVEGITLVEIVCPNGHEQ